MSLTPGSRRATPVEGPANAMSDRCVHRSCSFKQKTRSVSLCQRGYGWCMVLGPGNGHAGKDGTTGLCGSAHWRLAVRGLRLAGLGLFVAVGGLVTRVWSTDTGLTILTVGVGIYLVGHRGPLHRVHPCHPSAFKAPTLVLEAQAAAHARRVSALGTRIVELEHKPRCSADHRPGGVVSCSISASVSPSMTSPTTPRPIGVRLAHPTFFVRTPTPPSAGTPLSRTRRRATRRARS